VPLGNVRDLRVGDRHQSQRNIEGHLTMGVEDRTPQRPAPTEPSSLSSVQAESLEGTDLATDVSRVTDKTSYSIPEDGSPITISTGRRRDKDPKRTLSRRSQTSLLIEYFEGGKSGSNVQSRPSVRVKVTPSAARKIRDVGDHIQVTEVKEGSRVPSYTKRISLTPNSKGDRGIGESSDDRSISSYASATEDSNVTRRPPVEVEVMHKDHGSPISAASSPRHRRFIPPNPSEISSMPPDTFAEIQRGNTTPRGDRSRSASKENITMDTLKAPSRQRSVSRERLLAQKAMDKLESSRTRDSSGKHKKRSKSRSRSVSKELLETTKSPRRRSSRSHNEEYTTVDGSQPTDSQVSRRSAGQDSFRSGASGSSINNPKLLQTVEDVIRRLVLPEISEIRQEQKSQRNRDHFESGRRDSGASIESTSRESGRRRVSKTSSAPDVAGAPKVVLNRSEHEPGELLSSNSIKGRKLQKGDKGFVESPSERAYSEDTATEDSVHRKRSRRSGAKDAALAGAGAALTLEALHRHDSKSSLEKEKRRRKRSKSRSRSASLAESHDMASKDGPPMPMGSDLNSSELTRESILTEYTDRPPSAASQDRQTSRVLSSGSRTPTKAPTDPRKGLGTHHTNLPHGGLGPYSTKSDRGMGESSPTSKIAEAAAAAAALGLGAAALSGKTHSDHPEKDEWFQSKGQGRMLSPIQSVSSFKGDHVLNYPDGHDSTRQVHSADSISSQIEPPNEHPSKISTGTVPSTPNKHSSVQRPQGTSREIKSGTSGTPPSKEADSQYWYEQHQENDRNRQTFGNPTRDPTIDTKRMTTYTDDSLDSNYHDKAAAGQQVLGLGANPEYRYTPVAARSAVASLHEASNLDTRSLGSDYSKFDRQSYADSLDEDHHGGGFYHGSLGREAGSQGDSPTKRGIHTSQSDGAQSTSQKSFQERMATDAAPQPSSARHMAQVEDEHIPMTASGLPVADDPMPAIGYGHDDESDIQTNPSIIQGPIGGGHYGTRNNIIDSSKDHGDQRGPSATGAAIAGGATAAGLGALASGHTRDLGRDQGDLDWIGRSKENLERPESLDDYEQGRYIPPTPPNKDEGYISAAPNARSPGGVTPDFSGKAPKLFDEDDPDGIRGLDGMLDDDDPFVGQGHTRHLSGYSHGMPSPLYDSATGKGIDRIQSKDIVALMDHLTVRDAQRNARDTEILVTLVRSAAEMRNSFEDMKKLLSDSERNIILGTDKNTERTIQKHIQGPRPQPLGTPRIPRGSSVEDENLEDLPAKRRNVFKRALKGLSMRSSNDLAKIEEMLVQLLGEVEGLKTAQEYRPDEYPPAGANANSLASDDNLHGGQDGYEPEGQAGTSSTTQSGFFSNPSSRQVGAMRGYEGRRISEHRISTVPEGDEEAAYEEYHNTQHDDYDQQHLDQHYDDYEDRLTPSNEVHRGASVPLDTPPKINAQPAPLSNENTPRTDKSRKHKSGSSSIFPKFSRWSETTASTVARFRGNPRKNDPHDTLSHSGSEHDFWDHPPPPPLPQQHPQPSDQMRSMYPIDPASGHHEDRTPSPLLPHEDLDEPKRQAFRNSMNLQHPQPRPGPTPRYQHQLESQAQNFDSPVSPSSDQWGSNPNLQRYSTGSNHRYSGGQGNLSPISDDGHSHRSVSDQAPPRPAKIPEDPLVPHRPAKIRGTENKPQITSPLSSEHLPTMNDMENRYSNASSGYGVCSEYLKMMPRC
jgi:hypothetical protein